MRWPCWIGHDWDKWVEYVNKMVNLNNRTGKETKYESRCQKRRCSVCGFIQEVDIDNGLGS